MTKKFVPFNWNAWGPDENNNNASVPPTETGSSKSIGEPFPTGINVIAAGVDPDVDIVAIHGLNGHPEKTWTAASGFNWLRDFLPRDITNARICTWGYNANTHARECSQQYIHNHANDLISDLCLHRTLTATERRPIIFIAHSLGGIILKFALISSDMARKDALEDHRLIKVSTYGIIFMGTPHQGCDGATLGKIFLDMASIFVSTNDRILRNLQKDSELLQSHMTLYNPISRDFVTKFAYETYTTSITGHKSIMVVPQASAVIPGAANAEPFSILANHLGMVKFDSREDSGYRKVAGHLVLLAKAAPVANAKTKKDRF